MIADFKAQNIYIKPLLKTKNVQNKPYFEKISFQKLSKSSPID
jgi:hypothetical protein